MHNEYTVIKAAKGYMVVINNKYYCFSKKADAVRFWTKRTNWINEK